MTYLPDENDALDCLQKLMSGINPVDGSIIPGGEIVRDEYVLQCLNITYNALNKTEIRRADNCDLTLSEYITYLNNRKPDPERPKAGYRDMLSWLVYTELLEISADTGDKKVTADGRKLGIYKQRMSNRGYPDSAVIILNTTAQNILSEYADCFVRKAKWTSKFGTWTDEDIPKFKKLLEKGISLKSISLIMNRTMLDVYMAYSQINSRNATGRAENPGKKTSDSTYISKQEKQKFEFSDSRISSGEIAVRLNKIIVRHNLMPLTQADIESWLVETRLVNILLSKPLNDGVKLGIGLDKIGRISFGKTGQVFVVLFINYLIDHITRHPRAQANWTDDDEKAFQYLLQKKISVDTISRILNVNLDFVYNKAVKFTGAAMQPKTISVNNQLPSLKKTQKAPRSDARPHRKTNKKSPNYNKTSYIPHKVVEIRQADNEPYTCKDCMLYKNETCFGKKELCADFNPAPRVSKSEMELWPKYGDATRFKLGEKLPSD